MRILAITPMVQQRILDVVQYAQNNVIDLDTIKRLAEAADGTYSPIGDNLNRTMEIAMGFMVTFSIEEQPPGLYRHISVSVDGEGAAPNIEAVNMIMHEFGFDDLHVTEPTDTRQITLNKSARRPVIDVMELISSKPIPGTLNWNQLTTC